MSWREAAKETLHELRSEGVEETVEDVEDGYTVDQTELGKILLISSMALMVASIPSAITLQSAHDDVQSVNQEMDQVQGIIASERFSSGMETLQARIGGSLGRTLEQVMTGIETTNQSVSQLESTESDLQQSAEMYRWLSLISILGAISGVVTMYI